MSPHTNNSLHLEVNRKNDAAVMKVSGSVSMSEAQQLREGLENLVSEQIPLVVLDLSEMDFICSLGLGAIIAAHLKSRHHQGQIKLANPIAPVRRLLVTTRLNKLFSIHETVEEALSGT